MTTAKPATIDEYIAGFPRPVQEAMEQIRAAIKKAAPEAEEIISYAMPTFTLNKTYLVYFAGYKNHIGFYPAPVENETFKEEFSAYKTGKGTVQFPLDKPMPLDLVTRIVEFRIRENLARTNKKRSRS
jgi:uncharacterized protein YdhG (YjbR/CyaY superfamily)